MNTRSRVEAGSKQGLDNFLLGGKPVLGRRKL